MVNPPRVLYTVTYACGTMDEAWSVHERTKDAGNYLYSKMENPCQICYYFPVVDWDEVCYNCYWSYMDIPPSDASHLDEHAEKYREAANKYKLEISEEQIQELFEDES